MAPMHVTADVTLADLLHRYDTAKQARARWEVEEKALKGAILEHLGYQPDDDNPKPVVAEDSATGKPILATKVGFWRGLDQKRLREERPDIWAEFETSKPTVQITYES